MAKLYDVDKGILTKRSSERYGLIVPVKEPIHQDDPPARIRARKREPEERDLSPELDECLSALHTRAYLTQNR